MSFNVGESLVGEGNEVAHIDLLIGDKNGPVGTAFANALADQKAGHSNLLAVLEPNLAVKPSTVMITKVTIKVLAKPFKCSDRLKQPLPMLSPMLSKKEPFLKINARVCALFVVCSSTGKQPTTRKFTTTITQPLKSQSNVR